MQIALRMCGAGLGTKSESRRACILTLFLGFPPWKPAEPGEDPPGGVSPPSLRRGAGACEGPTCSAGESGGFLSDLTPSWDSKLLLCAASSRFVFSGPSRPPGMCFVRRGRKGYSPNWEQRSEGRGEKRHGKPGALGPETQSARPGRACPRAPRGCPAQEAAGPGSSFQTSSPPYF